MRHSTSMPVMRSRRRDRVSGGLSLLASQEHDGDQRRTTHHACQPKEAPFSGSPQRLPLSTSIARWVSSRSSSSPRRRLSKRPVLPSSQRVTELATNPLLMHCSQIDNVHPGALDFSLREHLGGGGSNDPSCLSAHIVAQGIVVPSTESGISERSAHIAP